jgi:hypothetical protein
LLPEAFTVALPSMMMPLVAKMPQRPVALTVALPLIVIFLLAKMPL